MGSYCSKCTEHVPTDPQPHQFTIIEESPSKRHVLYNGELVS